MDATHMLEQLEQLCRALGIAVRYEQLNQDDNNLNIGSGLCRLKEKSILFVDNRLPKRAQCLVISKELKHFDLSSVFMPPAVRDLIEP